MKNSTRASALISILFAGALIAGCAENPQAKVPTNVGDQGAPPPQPVPTASNTVAPAPPPVDAVAPNKVFVIELDAAGRPLVDGETIEVKYDRMIFLRDSRMTPDCSNVTVSNLYMKAMGPVCQVGILPLEQGLKPGEQKTASWKVGSETRSFSFKILPTDGNKKAESAAEDDHASLWRHAKSWLQENVLLAMR